MLKKKCTICGSERSIKVHDQIREFKNNVLKCLNCETVFLENYKSINYKEEYGTKLFDSDWNLNKILKERTKSLKTITNEIISLINKNKSKDILELGPGYGSTLIDLQKKLLNNNFSCLEQNKNYISIIKAKSKTEVYSDLKKINKKFDFIFGIHFIEHLEKPISFLKKIKKKMNKNGMLFLVTPNHDDFYMKSLPNNSLSNYKTFIYHAAHPFYFNKNSLNLILDKAGFNKNSIKTDQDYSILNYINWYALGKPSKNITSARQIDNKIYGIDKVFKKYINKINFGSNLWSVSINS